MEYFALKNTCLEVYYWLRSFFFTKNVVKYTGSGFSQRPKRVESVESVKANNDRPYVAVADRK